nr:hypothetical protein [uncultured Psychroserpens sp.]
MENKEKKDDYFYKVVQDVEAQEKKSFRRSVLISTLLVALTLIIVFLAFKNSLSKQNEIEKKSDAIIVLQNENKKQSNTISETVDAIEYLKEEIDTNSISNEAKELINKTRDNLIHTNEALFTKYNINDNLYIWSKKGLVLRSRPNGERIGSSDFADSVKVLSLGSVKHIDTIIRKDKYIKNYFTIEGKWIKVQTQSTGYMFDGYLSKLPTYPDQNYTLNQYYEFIKTNPNFEVSYKRLNRQKEILKISNISIAEACLLCNTIYPLEDTKNKKIRYSKAFNKWEFIQPNFVLIIQKQKGFVNIIVNSNRLNR